jgi:hypothetical protein
MHLCTMFLMYGVAGFAKHTVLAIREASAATKA